MSKRKSRPTTAGMDDRVPIVVRMRVDCARCGHSEDETYEFDMAFKKAQPREEYAPAHARSAGLRSRFTFSGDSRGSRLSAPISPRATRLGSRFEYPQASVTLN